jgi:hypothetical protein
MQVLTVNVQDTQLCLLDLCKHLKVVGGLLLLCAATSVHFFLAICVCARLHLWLELCKKLPEVVHCVTDTHVSAPDDSIIKVCILIAVF